MLGIETSRGGELSVLVGGGATAQPKWSGALARFFAVARRVLAEVAAEINSARLGNRSFLAGHADDLGLRFYDVEDILSNYPLRLISPFEDTASIAGGLWSGRTLFGPAYDDALAKLRFSSGTLELPIHTHDYSDRFIAVAAGCGRFWWSQAPRDKFDGCGVESMPVRVGDVLVFTRGLLHTFSAPTDDLLLLSFHSPEIPFNDPRQFTLSKTLWTPRMVEVM